MTTQIVARGLARAWLPILLGSFFEALKFSPKAIQKGLFWSQSNKALKGLNWTNKDGKIKC